MNIASRCMNEWEELLLIQLNSFSELAQPTEKSPHRQLMHLFTSVYKTKTSESHRADVKSTLKHVSTLMEEKFGDEPVYLNKAFNEYSLDEFHAYLKRCISRDKLHNRYANVLQTTYKCLLNRAIDIKIQNFEKFYLPPAFCYNTRVTCRYKPYSQEERVRIINAIDSDIAEYTKLTKPYVKSGLGRPVINSKGKLIIRKKDNPSIDEARWLFENRMNCTPVRNSTEIQSNRVNRIFYRIIKSNNLFYQDVFESWGTLCRVTVAHLLPFLLKLLQVTGMNIESIYALEIDDFVDKHPATGKACIRYWKGRSTGEKLYHLDIFNAKLQWLTNSQSQQVKSIFETVLKLTAYLRQRAPVKQKTKLWIFESANGYIRHLPNSSIMANAMSDYSHKHKLFNKTDGSKILETTRFRPTFVSELVSSGVSIREIQLLLGHKSLYSTMRYLDLHDFGHTARRQLNEKLGEIHKNALTLVKNRSQKKSKQKKKLEPSYISTPLATCKNIFDPPQSVRNLANYTPGKPCSTYNMCLSCPNVIITKTDLPKLFAMKRDYLVKVQNSRVLDTPFGRIIKSNLALLNSILEEDQTGFSPDELDEAEMLSLYVETTELI